MKEEERKQLLEKLKKDKEIIKKFLESKGRKYTTLKDKKTKK